MPRPAWSLRLVVVCLVAVSVAFPIAWISLAKVLLVVTGLIVIARNLLVRRVDLNRISGMEPLRTPAIILWILLAFSLSLLWAEASLATGLASLVKHGKLLTVVLLVLLIRNANEARIALLAFATGQVFLLAASWLLAAGVPNPWAATSAGKNVVFSSYLDQSIIFATAAAVFWHLRHEKLWPARLGTGLAAAAMANTLLLLAGRTGYAVAVTLISLGVMWATPRHLRLVTLALTPALLVAALYLGSATVQDRLTRVVDEGQNYGTLAVTESSSGWRLNAWKRSVEAIAERPIAGHGIGSWTQTVKRLEGSGADKIFGTGNSSNPHEEYLLWGVELGVGGIFALIWLYWTIARDATQFDTATSRAALSTLAALAIACLFNSTLYDGLIGDYFCTVVGLLLALGIRCGKPELLAADQDNGAIWKEEPASGRPA